MIRDKKFACILGALVMTISVVMDVNLLEASAQEVEEEQCIVQYEEYYTRPYRIKVFDISGKAVLEKFIDEYNGEDLFIGTVVTEESNDYNYEIYKWEKNVDREAKIIEMHPCYNKKLKEYKYSVIYRCDNEVLNKKEGKGKLGEKLSVDAEKFSGYEVNVDAKTSLTVTKNEKDNVLYVDYHKIEEVCSKKAETQSQKTEPTGDINKKKKISNEYKFESNTEKAVDKTEEAAKAEGTIETPKAPLEDENCDEDNNVEAESVQVEEASFPQLITTILSVITVAGNALRRKTY